MARDVTMELEQDGVFGSRRQVQLLDNRELRIVEQQKRNTKEYSIDLLALDSSSRSKICMAWPWLLAAGGILLLTFLVMWLLPQYAPSQSDLLSIVVMILGGLAATGCFYMFWMYTSRRQRFFSRHARIPLLELQVGKPTSKEFKQFVEYLEKRINNLYEHFDLSDEQQLSGEMRMLRRLSSKNILSETDYERAKEKLINRFS